MGAVEYLLDTHTLLWTVRGSPKLSSTAGKIIHDASIKKFISAVSAYEIMNKYRMGKLDEFADVAENYLDVLNELGAERLSIDTSHAHLAGKIEWTHRDPFDRLLAAQASVENLTLITNDPAFQSLPWVTVLW